MTPQTAETKFERWAVPEVALSIEYPPELMDEIRAAGSGVLFGTHQDDSVRVSVRVLAWRPLAVASGESRDVVRLLLAAKQDAALEALQPLGWFVTHKSGGIALSASDIEIFDGFFPEQWQVTLVLGEQRAGFFVRETGSQLRSHSSYREFPIKAQPKAKHVRWLWAIPTLIAIILAGLLIKPQSPEPAAPNPGFALEIQQDGEIRWDSASVRQASRAEMDIQDGAQRSHFALTGAQLREGKLQWQRHTADVQVRMTVYSAKGAAARESARLRVATITVAAPPAPAEPAPEVKKLTGELHQERVRSEKLKNMVKILENRLGIDGARKP